MRLLGGRSEDGADGAAQDPSRPPDPEAVTRPGTAASAGDDPDVAAATVALLERQARLVDVQRRQLESDQAARSAHLRSQLLGQRLRIAFQVFTALAVTVLGVGLILLLRDAFSSRAVIVEAFDTPAALAARGLTGTVVASDLLDELARLHAATHTEEGKRSLAGAWTGNIKLEAPGTGISIGEFSRVLHARFGHDIHIEGHLVETAQGGLALTTRGDGVPARTFVGGSGDLSKLIASAAEYLYGQSQPALFITYLINDGRDAEAAAFAQAMFAAARAEDRPYILNGWANALQNLGAPEPEALRLYREAVRLKRDYWSAISNAVSARWIMGDEEGAWRDGRAMQRDAGGRPGKAPEIDYLTEDTLTWNLGAWRAALEAEHAAHADVGTGASSDGPAIADADARLHDPASAAFQLQLTRGEPSDPTVAALTHFVRGRLAAEAGDIPSALREMEAFGAAYRNPIVASGYPGYACWIAPVEEAAGHPAQADALLRSLGSFVDCYRFKGDILDRRGDAEGAKRAYAAAVALAPDLPAGYYSWGLALARRGDLPAALVKLRQASYRGPHWADPAKAMGDVLARQGKWREALQQYDRAMKFAPAWKDLVEARNRAALQARS